MKETCKVRRGFLASACGACGWLIVRRAALVDAPPAAQAAEPSTAGGPVPELAFTGRRGVGGIKTFAWPAKRDINKGTFVADPYRPSWAEEMLAGRLQELRQAGFDFLRLNVNPGPLFAAGPRDFERLVGEIEFAVTSTVANGLKVVLDIHASENDPVWGAEKITSSLSQSAFQRYLETLRRLARLVDRFDPRLVALELFNEPPPPCQWSGRPSWPDQVRIIHGEARHHTPAHTLIVAGACYASIEGLTLLDGSSFDANTMFTVHYYEPNIFTSQGSWASSDKFMQYIAPLPYPVVPSMLAPTLARVQLAMARARGLAPDEREAEWLKAKRRLEDYFSEPSGTAVVETRFGEIQAWAVRHGIMPARILIGEFGVMKDIYGYTGARPEDRLRWLGDVRRTSEKLGFAWSVWALTNTMGIVTRDLDGPLDASVLEALGLRGSSSSLPP